MIVETIIEAARDELAVGVGIYGVRLARRLGAAWIRSVLRGLVATDVSDW